MYPRVMLKMDEFSNIQDERALNSGKLFEVRVRRGGDASRENESEETLASKHES